jgi:hypothetical protein
MERTQRSSRPAKVNGYAYAGSLPAAAALENKQQTHLSIMWVASSQLLQHSLSSALNTSATTQPPSPFTL